MRAYHISSILSIRFKIIEHRMVLFFYLFLFSVNMYTIGSVLSAIKKKPKNTFNLCLIQLYASLPPVLLKKISSKMPPSFLSHILYVVIFSPFSRAYYVNSKLLTAFKKWQLLAVKLQNSCAGVIVSAWKHFPTKVQFIQYSVARIMIMLDEYDECTVDHSVWKSVWL